MRRSGYLLCGLIALTRVMLIDSAFSYDVTCQSPENPEEGVTVSTPSRHFISVQQLEDGRTRRIKINDLLYTDVGNNYVQYSDGKHTITYSLKCDRL